jgi:hypothetical protein
MTRPGLSVFRWIWTTAIVALTSVPFLVSWWSTPIGYQYTWIIPPYPEDSFGYMAWAQQAAHGAWLFKVKYTALPHPAFLFHPLFLLCGWFSALLQCNVGIIFLGFKAVGVAAFFLTFYRYVDFLALPAFSSVIASVLVGISSGFGGILAWLGVNTGWALTSADRWMPEVSTFWSLLWNPLFPFSLTLMLLSIYWIDRATREGLLSNAWWSGVATGLAALLHPYSIPLLFIFAAVVAVVRQRLGATAYLLRYFAVSLPVVTYVAVVSRLNPVAAQHNLSGTMPSPAIVSYALGFGLTLCLPLVWLLVERRIARQYWEVAFWFIAALALSYMPFWFQRKLIFGAHVALCILSAVVLEAIRRRLPRTALLKWSLVPAALLLVPVFAATSIDLVRSVHEQVRANREGAYYVSDQLIDGLKALSQHSRPDDIVLATVSTSRFIPAIAGNTVIWGHWAMSVDYNDRRASINRVVGVVSDLTDEARSAELWANGVKFIFADGELKLSMEQHPFLWGRILKDTQKIFQNDQVIIYERG